MNIKVQGGVIGADPGRYGLCTQCANAFIRESADGDVDVWCEYAASAHARITKPLIRCSAFLDHNQPSKYDLEKIAWVLTTDKKAGKVGFLPPVRREE